MPETVKVIGFDDIATTVKLVSINASIEATYAGQYGPGFQVLAKETGKLSESTRQNADSITQTLRSVTNMVQTSIATSRESASSFKQQETFTHELFDALYTVAEYMKQLDEASNRLLTVMEHA